jgi:putative chitinase
LLQQPITNEAENGLVPDGILGKNTFSKMKSVWKIKLNTQLANYLGQSDHETGGFQGGLENLNYSKEGLLKIFGKYFTTNQAAEPHKAHVNQYARQPEKIANRVYANRMGNGDEASGDGWAHIGAGGLQLTGSRNYELFRKWMGLKEVPTKEEIAEKYYWEVGLFYFEVNNLWAIAAKTNLNSITRLSKAINRGNPDSKHAPHGLKERIERTQHYDKIIK